MPCDWLDEALANFGRIAITGGPKSGKTTICQRINGRPVIHGDDFIDQGWSGSSEALARKVNDYHGPLVVEGVQVPRALRKGMRVDAVYWLEEHFGGYVRGHGPMKEGAMTVLNQWRASNPKVPVFIIAPKQIKSAMPVQVYPPATHPHIRGEMK